MPPTPHTVLHVPILTQYSDTGQSLCARGARHVTNMAQYVYTHNGKAYSVAAKNRGLVHEIEIPANFEAVSELMRALEYGLKIKKAQARVVVHDQRSDAEQGPATPVTPAAPRCLKRLSRCNLVIVTILRLLRSNKLRPSRSAPTMATCAAPCTKKTCLSSLSKSTTLVLESRLLTSISDELVRGHIRTRHSSISRRQKYFLIVFLAIVGLNQELLSTALRSNQKNIPGNRRQFFFRCGKNSLIWQGNTYLYFYVPYAVYIILPAQLCKYNWRKNIPLQTFIK
ncbi:hypothetical protein CISG_04613 [Coccidioides immitis RMSCC 3703]|uniref:Uncharacterized protein n=1 Tax=Coccidioides immitis RMSCC 3703 TaxID=454286 RepID=A0A0J8QP48_COCIT|nr:hypothetical protein CISG_04613 [Coccidioides immitis RMSCC 3703]